MINLISILMILSFLPLSTSAEVKDNLKDNPCMSQVGKITKIYFVNGVWVTQERANTTVSEIKAAYKVDLEKRFPGQIFEFESAYNKTEGKVNDLMEVLGQKINESKDPEIKKYTAEEYYNLYLDFKNESKNDPVLVKPLVAPLIKIIENYLVNRMNEKVNAENLIQKYRSDLDQGVRVLLIAHSQGNLFADEAIEALKSEYGKNIGMIGLASPLYKLNNNSVYYTANDDKIINLARIANLTNLKYNILPSNINNDLGITNDQRDFDNHQFLSSYFKENLPSRKKINESVNSSVLNLNFPKTQLGSGAITVTLEWGDEKDLDLHILEPNSSNVHWFLKEGKVGIMDLDDKDKFGPEHYYIPCDKLSTGIYKINTNYYEGNNLEKARVQISTADGKTISFHKELPQALGYLGIDNPTPIATINVLKENGKYRYVVEGR